MSLMEQIKQKQVEARKSGDSSAGVFTTLLGEASMIGKNAGNRETTDQEVIQVVKKFIKNIDETIKALAERGQNTASFFNERAILEQFLPTQLNEATLFKIAAKFSTMPEFMKYLKEHHAGQYDGKLASTVAKSSYK